MLKLRVDSKTIFKNIHVFGLVPSVTLAFNYTLAFYKFTNTKKKLLAVFLHTMLVYATLDYKTTLLIIFIASGYSPLIIFANTKRK